MGRPCVAEPDRVIGPMTAADAAEAGALVAARHVSERARFPLLPAAFEDPSWAAELVDRTLTVADGVVARDVTGRLRGFLTAIDSRPDPSGPTARYAPERSALHLVHAHAVTADVAPGPVYAELFAALAAAALERGVTDHVVHLPIGEPSVEAAWVALGFGRSSVVAVRDLRPIQRSEDAVEVRVATPHDLDTVDVLVDEESVFHAASPIFRPYRRAETNDAVRAQLAIDLASDDHAVLVARRDGDDVGVLCIGPGQGSPLYVPEGAAYIATTAVLPSCRGAGVGTALADAAFGWAKDHGHRAACLHFASANATSTSFWTGIGFCPVMAHVRRRLDERIVTSRPPP